MTFTPVSDYFTSATDETGQVWSARERVDLSDFGFKNLEATGSDAEPDEPKPQDDFGFRRRS